MTTTKQNLNNNMISVKEYNELLKQHTMLSTQYNALTSENIKLKNKIKTREDSIVFIEIEYDRLFMEVEYSLFALKEKHKQVQQGIKNFEEKNKYDNN